MPDVPLSREQPLDRHVLVERVPVDASGTQLAGCAFLRGRGEQGLLLSGLLLLAGAWVSGAPPCFLGIWTLARHPQQTTVTVE